MLRELNLDLRLLFYSGEKSLACGDSAYDFLIVANGRV